MLLGAIEAEICCEHFLYESGYIYITSLAVAILDFLTPLTLDSIHNRVCEILDPENLGVAVEIAFLCAIDAELHLFYAAFAWSAI